MAKKGSASTKKRRRGEAWTGVDHAIRSAKQQAKAHASGSTDTMSYRERRAVALTHDSKEKIDDNKLRLHIVKTEREVERMRERLRAWDDVEEEARKEKFKRLEEDKKQEEQPKKKQKGRSGPETWKLRGAARPAWEVYDFDTRYDDPHLKAHEEARNKAQRSRNLLVIYKGRLGQQNDDDDNDNDRNGPPPQPHCRNFLALLMQLGMLCLQAKKYKKARTAFLECMDLDGTDKPITTARCQLMRLYLEANRPDSARRLWEKLPHDKSIWIRYSAALLEFVSWKLLGEMGSTRETAEQLLSQAIRANVFCAYYIAYHSTFERVMEYTEEIQDATEQTLEEAIEYCCSEEMGAWVGTDGAIPWLRSVILRALHGGGGNTLLSSTDLEWSDKLKRLEQDYEAFQNNKEEDEDKASDNNSTEEEEEIDILMYAGMFRTAMDMLEDAGEFIAKDLNESEDEGESSVTEEEQTDSGDLKRSSVQSAGESSDASDTSDS